MCHFFDHIVQWSQNRYGNDIIYVGEICCIFSAHVYLLMQLTLLDLLGRICSKYCTDICGTHFDHAAKLGHLILDSPDMNLQVCQRDELDRHAISLVLNVSCTLWNNCRCWFELIVNGFYQRIFASVRQEIF